MLLDNIRHLRSEVEKTNREINRSRQERLYADLLKDDVYEERELPYGSRFFKTKTAENDSYNRNCRASIN